MSNTTTANNIIIIINTLATLCGSNKAPKGLTVDVTYTGSKTRFETCVQVAKTKLDIKPSLKIFKHSPAGFEWGYLGSGPAQLALAILLDATGDKAVATAFYQKFKTEVVATWGNTWQMSRSEVNNWLALQRG